MKQLKFVLVLVLALASFPAWSGSIGYAQNESCTVAADVVSCVTTPGRGTLVIEASDEAFGFLRDALTPNWDGFLVCALAHVEAGVTGCNAEGDQVAMSRKSAALITFYVSVRSTIVRRQLAAAIEAAKQTVDPNPDIGGGDPG